MEMKIKILYLPVLLIFLLSCATSERKQAKIYENGLESMVKKDSAEVISKITSKWNFKLAGRWDTEDPSVESVLQRSRGRTAFTRQEAAGHEYNFAHERGLYLLFKHFISRSTTEIAHISSIPTAPHSVPGDSLPRKSYSNLALLHESEDEVVRSSLFDQGCLLCYRFYIGIVHANKSKDSV